MLGDSSLAGRASLLKSLVKKAGSLGDGKMVLRPTKIDKAALQDSAKGYSVGSEVDGLGGFVLEAEDGTLSFDLRFDTLLENAWVEQRAAVNETLFG
jgi:vacuolar-type H+-ATPase subunit E/Vma4